MWHRRGELFDLFYAISICAREGDGSDLQCNRNTLEHVL